MVQDTVTAVHFRDTVINSYIRFIAMLVAIIAILIFGQQKFMEWQIVSAQQKVAELTKNGPVAAQTYESWNQDLHYEQEIARGESYSGVVIRSIAFLVSGLLACIALSSLSVLYRILLKDSNEQKTYCSAIWFPFTQTVCIWLR